MKFPPNGPAIPAPSRDLPASRVRSAERGITLPEILILVAIFLAIVIVAATYSLSWLNAEEARSAVYQTQMLVQLARVEAVSRNHPCRFEIDTTTRELRVVDLNDPSNATDDITLANVALSTKVNLVDPGGGAAVTLQNLSGSRYHATFAPDGSVSSGAGAIHFQGAHRFDRLSLFAAGGIKVEKWDGGAWQAGS